MRRVIALVGVLLIACGGGSDTPASPAANQAAATARDTGVTQVVTALVPTNTVAPTSTAIAMATATSVPTNTPMPTATHTPAPTRTPQPTRTPRPTNTPAPSPTPAPALSLFQVTEEAAGARYLPDRADKYKPVPDTGYVDGDEITFHMDDESQFGTRALIIQTICVRYSTPALAASWIDGRRQSVRRVYTNVHDDQQIDSQADAMFGASALFTSAGTVYQVSELWMQIGSTACEYEGLDPTYESLPQLTDMANHIVARVKGQ